ncbi:MgtC/SapB family protein [Phyllobacterium ifriqiyense]|uniref:MgtC/SapB family protein n=1 Tax=Phyllobacterium ifriqiyense TaxID=314238 RepID=UPI0033952BB0
MDPLILRLGLAFAIGTLIGLERGWRERDAPGGSRTAGIRTFGMAGFFGGILAVIASAFAAPSVFIAGFLGFSAIFAVFEYRETQRDNVFSVTSTIAAMSVVVLGGLAVVGDFRAAAAGGAAIACLLASREVLHGLLKRLSWNEVRSTLTLVAMTAIGLPLLPNRAIDPWGGFNPFEVWLLTVLAGAISYIGYIAIRLLGPRGIIPASLLGAIVSSMAVTAALGRQVRLGDSLFMMVGGACLAGMVSILRVGLLLTLIQPGLVNSIFLPMCVASIVLGAIGAILSLNTVAAIPESPARRNPFDVAALLIFAAAFALISTLSAGLVQHFGAQSVLVTSSLAAVADVDIAVLSALRMGDSSIDPVLIGNAILLALATNGVSRIGLAAFTGGTKYAVGLALASLTAIALGAASLLV